MFYKVSLYKNNNGRMNNMVPIESIIVEKKVFSVKEISSNKNILTLNENSLHKYPNFLFILESELCQNNIARIDDIIKYMEENKTEKFRGNILKASIFYNACDQLPNMDYYNVDLWQCINGNRMEKSQQFFIDKIIVKRVFFTAKEICTDEKIKIFDYYEDVPVNQNFIYISNNSFKMSDKASLDDIMSYIDAFNYNYFEDLLYEDYSYIRKKQKQAKKYIKEMRR